MRVVRTGHTRDGASAVGSRNPELATEINGHVGNRRRESQDGVRIGDKDQRLISFRITCIESLQLLAYQCGTRIMVRLFLFILLVPIMCIVHAVVSLQPLVVYFYPHHDRHIMDPYIQLLEYSCIPQLFTLRISCSQLPVCFSDQWETCEIIILLQGLPGGPRIPSSLSSSERTLLHLSAYVGLFSSTACLVRSVSLYSEGSGPDEEEEMPRLKDHQNSEE